MAFHPQNMPLPMQVEWVKGPGNWKGLVHSALHMGLFDMNYVTSIVFYLCHPERNFRQIQPSETALITEWKEWKKRILSEVQLPGPAPSPLPVLPPAPVAPSWPSDPAEIERIRDEYGSSVADWASIAPEGVEAAEFAPPAWLQNDYAVIFAWKSAQPATKCVPDPKRQVQMVVLLRGDKAYWRNRTNGKERATSILSTTASTAIRDYREFVVNRKMCPKSARIRLEQINMSVTAQLILAMLHLAAPGGVPNHWALHTQQFAAAMSKISEWCSPAVNKLPIELEMKRQKQELEARAAELERSSLLR